MTDDTMALRELLQTGSDAGLLREMISFAAQRLMELETEPLCGAAHGERSPERLNQLNGWRTPLRAMTRGYLSDQDPENLPWHSWLERSSDMSVLIRRQFMISEEPQ